MRIVVSGVVVVVVVFVLFVFFFFFFFFQQKTAYEVSACLVGSEMVIRDSMSWSLRKR